MGDSRRSTLFAQFICKQFPKAKTVLCVADGKGHLARALANKKLTVTAIENKPRFAGRKHKRITYKRGLFGRHTPISEDVVVGMHPDEATCEIVLAAHNQHKPFAVVPCCIKGNPKIRSGVFGYMDWLKKIKTLCNGGCQEFQLHMNGKNIVVFKRS